MMASSSSLSSSCSIFRRYYFTTQGSIITTRNWRNSSLSSTCTATSISGVVSRYGRRLNDNGRGTIVQWPSSSSSIRSSSTSSIRRRGSSVLLLQQQQQQGKVLLLNLMKRNNNNKNISGNINIARSSCKQKRWSSSTATTTATATSSTTTTTKSKLTRKLLGEEPIIPCRSILPLSLVNRVEVVKALPYIGNCAYIAIASGFLMTDMLQLRILLVGGYTGLVLFHILRPAPLRIPLRWSGVFVLLNAGAAYLLLQDQYMAPLTDEQQELHKTNFAKLTPGQCYQLLSLGTWKDMKDQTILTLEGVPCSELYFIYQGQAKVYHHRDFVANIGAGGFVNDVAFQRGGEVGTVGAYGTVICNGDCKVLVWDQGTLRNHLQQRPQMDRNLKYLLSDHLVQSLLRQREVAHIRQKKRQEQEQAPGSAGEQQSPPQQQLVWNHPNITNNPNLTTATTTATITGTTSSETQHIQETATTSTTTTLSTSTSTAASADAAAAALSNVSSPPETAS